MTSFIPRIDLNIPANIVELLQICKEAFIFVYELQPAPDNPDRPRSIREQMKTAAKQAEADRGQAAPKKNAPDRGDR